jgi:NhaA family Na+:H+ antiporter
MTSTSAARARLALGPVTNGVILPDFAFVAALVPLPAVGITELGPAFLGILVALPLGKLVGVTAGATIMGAIAARGPADERPFRSAMSSRSRASAVSVLPSAGC